MAVNRIIECFSRDLVIEYCLGFESSEVYTGPPLFVETHPDCTNRSLARLPLHMYAQAIIPTFLMWNINVGLFLCIGLTLTQLRSYEMFTACIIVKPTKTWAFGEFATSSY